MNRRLADSITSFGGNEIAAWFGYFRNKAGLPAPVVAGNSGSTGTIQAQSMFLNAMEFFGLLKPI